MSFTYQQPPPVSAPMNAPIPQPPPKIDGWERFVQAASPLSEQGVTPQQVYNYARATGGAQPPHVLAAEAAADNLWAKEAKKQGVITGDSAMDNLAWREHWQYEQGMGGQDPLLSKFPQSAAALQQAVEKIVKNQRAAQWQEQNPIAPSGTGYQWNTNV